MKKADYEKLSALAPTIPAVKGSTDYFSPWDDQTELDRRRPGQGRGGQELVASVKAAYAKAAAEHPEFEGKTATFLQNALLRRHDLRVPGRAEHRVPDLPRLHHQPAAGRDPDAAGEQVGISAERFDIADADVMVFATEEASDVAALGKIPTFGKLGAVREHRAVFTDATLAGAIYFMTPLSLPYVLERLTPALAEAVAGEAPRAMMQAP